MVPRISRALAIAFFGVAAVFAAMSSTEFQQRVSVFRYRPSLFADQKLHVGLGQDAQALQGIPWYLRMQENDAALFGMDNLRRLVLANQVPGLDFTGFRRLTLLDIERLFAFDAWAQAPRTYRFRLLKLGRTTLDNRALGAISRLKDLEVLELSDRMTDAGLARLAAFKSLKVLTLDGPGITDAAGPALSTLKSLERLSVKGTQASDALLEAVKHLPLRQIDLSSAVTDRGLESLTSVLTLEHIDASLATLSGRGLQALAKLPALHTLLIGHSTTDEMAPELVRLKGLKRLDATGARFTDQGAAALAGLPRLEELALTETLVTSASLSVLAALPHLRYLELSDTPIATDAWMSATGFRELQVLSLSSSKKLAIEDVRPFARFPKLHTLIINGVPLPRRLLDSLRSKPAPRARLLEWLLPLAEAVPASDAEIEQVLQVASLTDKGGPKSFGGFSGLKRIHETEASLEEVVPATSKPAIDTFQENEKNFLGEITVNAGPPPKIRAGQ